MANNAPFRIPQEQWIARAKALAVIYEKTTRVKAHEATDMFELHNDVFRPEEFTKSCPKCVGRVWNRIKGRLQELEQVDKESLLIQ